MTSWLTYQELARARVRDLHREAARARLVRAARAPRPTVRSVEQPCR